MLAQGGLLTEFLTGTNPDKHNFVSRNRIVAGMSDATIVVESAAKEVPLSLQSWRRDTIVTVLPFRDVLRTNLPSVATG